MARIVATMFVLLSGTASRYDPGVMERVVERRLQPDALAWRYPLPVPLPDVDGYVAMRDAAMLGRVVYARPVTPGASLRWERFLVTDCAGSVEARRFMSVVPVEVDGVTAERWGMGPGRRNVPVQVLIPDLTVDRCPATGGWR